MSKLTNKVRGWFGMKPAPRDPQQILAEMEALELEPFLDLFRAARSINHDTFLDVLRADNRTQARVAMLRLLAELSQKVRKSNG